MLLLKAHESILLISSDAELLRQLADRHGRLAIGQFQVRVPAREIELVRVADDHDLGRLLNARDEILELL